MTLTLMCLVFLSTTFWPWLILASLASWRRFSSEHIPVALIVDESLELDRNSKNLLMTISVVIILLGFPGLSPVEDIEDWDTGKEYRTITDVKGPLVFLNKTEPVAFGEIVELRLTDGTLKNGQVLDTSDDQVIVQVFEGTASIDKQTGIKFLGDVFKLPVSTDMIGRILDGAGRPRDGGPAIVADEMADIIGAAINPYSRQSPSSFIQTGISAIDACTSLVRGQKLPIFSASGLPHNDIALQIARQAKLVGSDDDFVVVFCAMGITAEEYNFFVHDLERTGALENACLFVNLADDPAVERLITPRLALTAAEYLAFEHDYHVLVIYTDMTNYCESLRQIGAAREEVPGRRGYPGYMYTDLAMLYERGILQ